ncbi:hypothetical protein ACFL0W_06450 [Nanoarchaeota archaeon]
MTHKILEIKDDSQLKELDSLFSDLISQKIYPLTKGVPFCCGKIEHCIELFIGKGIGKKPELCKDCKLISWCDYSGAKFDIKPIRECDKDLIEFLEDRDENINDWF